MGGVLCTLSLLLPCRLEHFATRLDCDVLLVTGTILKTPMDTFVVSDTHSEVEVDPSVAAAEQRVCLETHRASSACSEANPDPQTEPAAFSSFAPVDAIEIDEAGFMQASSSGRPSVSSAGKRKRYLSPPRPPSEDDKARTEAGSSSAGLSPEVGEQTRPPKGDDKARPAAGSSSDGQSPDIDEQLRLALVGTCPFESQRICCSCCLENPIALRIGCQGCEHLVCASCASLRGTVGHHWCPHCFEAEEEAEDVASLMQKVSSNSCSSKGSRHNEEGGEDEQIALAWQNGELEGEDLSRAGR